MRLTLRILGAAVVPITLFVAAAPAVATSARVAIAGDSVATEGAAVVGQVAIDQRVSLAVSLAPRNETGLAAFIADVSNPHSARYGHYLSTAQYAEQFGPSQDEVNKVGGYLREQGLSVDSISPSHLVIDASGTAGTIEKAFDTTLTTYRDNATQRAYYANASAPTLPADIAPSVVDIAGLSTRTQRLQNARLQPDNGPGGGYTPAQIKGGYDVNSLASAGINGTGQKVALLEFDGFQQSNISAYDSHYALSATTPAVHKVDGGSGALGDGQVEVELDIEVVQALAPKAAITVFEGPNSDAGEVDTYQAIVNSGTPVTSSSWGAAETERTSANIQAVDNVFRQGAAEGESVFAASGDSGSDDAGNGGQSVDYPASDPYVTGTGGTTLTVTSGNAWSRETAWSGSGGGVSSVFAQPSFQSGVTGTNGKRGVPDVSALANPSPGVSIYSQGQWGQVGGTSAAAPEWAGFAALYNQDAAGAGKPGLGWADPLIYQINASALHDITSGSNGAYKAGQGYDLVTGRGSYDAAKFVAASLG
ncbi:MAG TPA: S53 family serine peptidase [Pseudonocardiaceae bacterium]